MAGSHALKAYLATLHASVFDPILGKRKVIQMMRHRTGLLKANLTCLGTLPSSKDLSGPQSSDENIEYPILVFEIKEEIRNVPIVNQQYPNESFMPVRGLDELPKPPVANRHTPSSQARKIRKSFIDAR
ncbi:YABBY-like transcription factor GRAMINIFOLIA [Striga asiatica]|uniref:YABBY-like transcription factor GRAMINIFOLIA n=1 Tax=Striga asiatica TaxID=4170 RepID=A0A5A7QHN2_STRAF|nr:YABBY-like transcription factor GRAMINIFOLIA [Striga asiatica]